MLTFTGEYDVTFINSEYIALNQDDQGIINWKGRGTK